MYNDNISYNRQGPNNRPPRPPFSGPPNFNQQPGGPPFNEPPGPPSFNQPSGPPTGAPPSYTPQQSPGLFKVDPGAIRSCLYRYSYIWLNDGRSFWAWLTFVGRTSVAGWRWTGFSWRYFGTDLNNISSFECF